MKHILKRILTFLSAVLILAYIGLQIYRNTYLVVKTESAISMTTYQNINCDGYVIRNEQLISSGTQGIKVFTVTNGGRVPKNGVVAKVYESEAAAKAQDDIAKLNEKIDTLVTIQTQNEIYPADINMLNKQINEHMIAILNDVDYCNYKSAQTSKTELLNLLNKNQITISGDKNFNFNKEIAALKEKRDKLISAHNETPSKITSGAAGYFISTIDGYEGKINFNKALTLMPSDLKSITSNQVDENVIGKIVGDYEWYIATVLKFSEAINLRIGQNLSLKLPLASIDELPVTIAAVNKDSLAGHVAVVFRCEYMNSELSALRTQTMQVQMGKFTGLRVSTNAIRFVNGVKGVYVKIGNEAKFRNIDVVFTGNGYLICKSNSTNSKALKLYDEIIVEGKNLYDGKILK